jgi:hypothetical protein
MACQTPEIEHRVRVSETRVLKGLCGAEGEGVMDSGMTSECHKMVLNVFRRLTEFTVYHATKCLLRCSKETALS